MNLREAGTRYVVSLFGWLWQPATYDRLVVAAIRAATGRPRHRDGQLLTLEGTVRMTGYLRFVTEPGEGITPAPFLSHARADGVVASNGLASAGGEVKEGRRRSSMSSGADALASR